MRTLPELPRHWRNDTNAQRLTIGRRLDGVEVLIELTPDSGAPLFYARFAGAPGVERIELLEGATDTAAAVAQVEERWPPSPWMTDLPGDPDYGPGSGRAYMVPMQVHGEPGPVTIDFREGHEHADVRLQTPPIHYAGFQVLGLRVRLLGDDCKAHVSRYAVDGDKNLLYEGLDVIGLPTTADLQAAASKGIGEVETASIRENAILQPRVSVGAQIRVEGTGRAVLTAEMIGRCIYDPAGRLEHRGGPRAAAGVVAPYSVA